MLQTLRLCFYIISKLGDELSHLPFSWKLWALHRGSFLLRKCDFFFFSFFSYIYLLWSSVASILHAKLWGRLLQEKKHLSWRCSCRSLSASRPFRKSAYLSPSVRLAFCSSKLQDMLWNLIHVVWSKDIFLLSMKLFCLMLLSFTGMSLSFTGISRANRKVSMQVRCRSCFLVYPGWEMNISKLILSFLALRNSVFLCRLCKRWRQSVSKENFVLKQVTSYFVTCL